MGCALRGLGRRGVNLWAACVALSSLLGTLASRAGPLIGACQQFQVTIKGLGGHAAMPHTVIDPIVASSHVIIALQVSILSNNQSMQWMYHDSWCT